ncbi:/ nrdI / NrdI Flavodoxin protein /:357467 Reverse [Candidatus Hepatoplasma crinochetorum]|uniref:/ nrdI / NrdI Flavodoxin protein /:357467 Reverse n=1 Tax=Candidatus Hepatoplasma crinochetorum TaxID=295596 RepID=A0A0G7ZL42_9MOLU|nr:/ nrdI / NrdI Flavodoxin protein /:357467 Reverse [Candidatus Hepatoplasma crinochetorum]
MKFVYFSLTGNTKKIAEKLNLFPIEEIKKNLIIDDKYILIASSVGFGQIQPEVKSFLESNSEKMIGVIGSGNRNWGQSYCKAAKTISKDYDVKYFASIELAGTNNQIEECKKNILEFLDNGN